MSVSIKVHSKKSEAVESSFIKDFRARMDTMNGELYDEEDILGWGWEWKSQDIGYPNGAKTYFEYFTMVDDGVPYTLVVKWNSFNDTIVGYDLWQERPSESKKSEGADGKLSVLLFQSDDYTKALKAHDALEELYLGLMDHIKYPVHVHMVEPTDEFGTYEVRASGKREPVQKFLNLYKDNYRKEGTPFYEEPRGSMWTEPADLQGYFNESFNKGDAKMLTITKHKFESKVARATQRRPFRSKVESNVDETTFKQAVDSFIECAPSGGWGDYWEMQQDWAAYIDGLCRDGSITQRQYDNFSNPCTPETFDRWQKRNGLTRRSGGYESKTHEAKKPEAKKPEAKKSEAAVVRDKQYYLDMFDKAYKECAQLDIDDGGDGQNWADYFANLGGDPTTFSQKEADEIVGYYMVFHPESESEPDAPYRDWLENLNLAKGDNPTALDNEITRILKALYAPEESKKPEANLGKQFEVLTKAVLHCCDNLVKDTSLAGEFDDEVIYTEDAIKNAVESMQTLGDACKSLKHVLEHHKNEDNMKVIGILSDAISQIVSDEEGEEANAEGEQAQDNEDSVIDQVEKEYSGTEEPAGGEELTSDGEPGEAPNPMGMPEPEL